MPCTTSIRTTVTPRVAAWTAPHRDRLVPFAVLRPNLTGWEADLDRCLGDHGMCGLVLHPNYHGYALNAPEVDALMERAAAAGLPVCVQAGIEDVRRQYERRMVEDLWPEDIGALVRRHPAVTFIVLGLKYGQPEQLGTPLPANCCFDTSNYEALEGLEEAAEGFGSDRILFGTHFPLFTPHANVEKLRCADLPDAACEAIAQGNAQRLLGL